jgi:transposase-like protein
MSISCSKCQSISHVKNGFVRDKQRYRCKNCFCNFTCGDGRNKYDNKTRNLAVRMYLNNCGFRRISEILQVPLSTSFSWIQKAGQIVDEIVRERKEQVEEIEVLEMDELFTFVKKNLKETRTQGNLVTPTPEYGLLWIGTDLKILRLK